MTRELLRQLNERGYKGTIVPIQHLRDLQEEIEGQRRQRLLDEELYQEYLAAFSFSPPESLPQARSLIVVAVPQPQIQATFTWNAGPLRLIVPPTYLAAQQVDNQVKGLLAETLRQEGYQVALAVVPKKLLAVRSGLGAYGKNNICYVDGMGSFHRLVALYSDLPCPEDNWQKLRMMESCQNCSACLHHCPAGAITSERFLLHAERCITFHNEKPTDVPFRAWMDPSWHNCLVGCMTCQRVCPQNQDVLDWVEEGPEFSREETTMLLHGDTLDQLPAATAEKLERSDMVTLLDVLPRNLGIFLE